MNSENLEILNECIQSLLLIQENASSCTKLQISNMIEVVVSDLKNIKESEEKYCDSEIAKSLWG